MLRLGCTAPPWGTLSEPAPQQQPHSRVCAHKGEFPALLIGEGGAVDADEGLRLLQQQGCAQGGQEGFGCHGSGPWTGVTLVWDLGRWAGGAAGTDEGWQRCLGANKRKKTAVWGGSGEKEGKPRRAAALGMLRCAAQPTAPRPPSDAGSTIYIIPCCLSGFRTCGW